MLLLRLTITFICLSVFQYELTVKRTEMRKLEEITAEEEHRIEKAEKDLEEDAVGFYT
jgi:hypothetical protein